MYFGSFAIFVHNNSINNGMVTAINPFSKQWDQIAMGLKSMTPNQNDPFVCDGDFSHYDGSMLTDFAWAILDIINNWYDDEHQGVRQILWLEIVNSRHLFNNIVYEWFGGMSSGNPLTLIINCMNNQLIHRYVFYKHHSRLLRFDDNVKLYVTGDDLAMAVSDKCKPTFNGVTIQKMMEEIGYTYTSADKTSGVVPFKRLSEITFLKRSFRYEKLLNRYLGCLDINSIIEIPLWTKNKESLAIFESNLKEFFDELSLHNEKVWNQYALKYIKAVETLAPQITCDGTLYWTRAQRLQNKLGEVLPFH